MIVASMDTAKRDPHREIVLGLDYDMLIVDEAHKLKNKKTTNYQFVGELRKKYCLLLTATPVQNDLKELYNLINLLKPGQLGAQTNFQANFVMAKRMPKNEGVLQQELSKIMIRNRRGDGNVEFKKRIVKISRLRFLLRNRRFTMASRILSAASMNKIRANRAIRWRLSPFKEKCAAPGTPFL